MSRETDRGSGILHKSGEDYLEAVLVLSLSNGEVRPIDIANYLNYSRPSVTSAVALLKQSGYLTIDERHHIDLTEAGRNIAEEIYNRHRFFRDFLVKAGADPERAEEDACRMEHAISAESFGHLKRYLESTGL